MSENMIDLRHGKVPTDTGIYYLRDYETQYTKMGYELLAKIIQF